MKRIKKLTVSVVAFSLGIPTVVATPALAASPAENPSPIQVPAAPAPKLDTRVGLVSPMESGATGMVWLSVTNVSLDSTSLSAPVSVRFDSLPTGVSFAALSPVATATSAGWSCGGTSCVYGTVASGGTVTPKVLLPGERAWGIASLSVAKDAPLTMISDELARQLLGSAGSADAAALESVNTYRISASATFPDGKNSSAAEGRLAGTAATGKVKVQTFITPPERVVSGTKVSWDVVVGNVGSVSAPSVTLAGLTATNKLSNLSFAGSGWTCDEVACSFKNELKKGELTPVLAISGTAPAFVAGKDSDGRDITENDISWRANVSAGDFAAVAHFDYPVVAPAPPDLLVGLSSASGVPVAVAGEKVGVKVSVTNLGGVANKSTVRVELPTAKFVSATGFTCVAVEGAAKCELGSIATKASPSGVLIFALDESKRDAIQVTASAVTPGEDAKTSGNNSAALPFVVRPAGEPIAALTSATGSGNNWKAGDPGIATVTPQSATKIAYVVRNVGSKEFSAGSKVSVAVTYPSSIRLASSGSWTCAPSSAAGSNDPVPTDAMIQSAVDAAGAVGVTNDNAAKAKAGRSVIACTQTLGVDVATDAALPALVFDVQVNGAPVAGSGVIAARIAGGTSVEPTIERLVVVDVPAADMELRATEPAAARVGDTSSFTVSVVNEGRLATAPVFAVRSSSALLADVKVSDGWNCVKVGGSLKASSLVCSAKALAPRAESPLATVELTPWDDTEGQGWTYDIVLVNGSSDPADDTVVHRTLRRQAPLAIDVTAPDKIADRRLPIGASTYVATTVSMSARTSAGEVSWAQVGDAKVKVDLIADGTNAHFAAPVVESPTTLSFAATVRDGSHSATDVVDVTVVPVVGYSPPDVASVGSAYSGRRLPRSVDSSGSSGSRPEFTVPRLNVNADALGDGRIEVSAGESVTAVAAASVSSGVTFSWSISGGDAALIADPAVTAALASTNSVLSFIAPSTQGTITFRVTATSGSYTASDDVTVVVGAAAPADVTFDIVGPTSPLVVTAGAAAANVAASAPAGSTLSWSVVEQTGGPISVSPTAGGAAVSASAMGAGVVSVTARGASGAIVGLGAFPVVVRPSGEITSLCELVDVAGDLISATSFLTGLDLAAELAAAAAACAGGNRITFSNKSASIGGFAVTGLSGSLDLGGLRLTGGTLTFPSSWPIDSVTLSDTGQGIVFPLLSDGTFGSPTATLTATFDSRLTAAVSFLSGWTWDTTIRIEDGRFAAASLSGQGPASGGVTPTFVAAGDLATNGNVTLEVSASGIQVVSGLAVDVSGSIGWSNSTLDFAVEGTATGSWQPFAGAQLSNIHVAFGTGTPTRLSGSLALTLGSSSVSVGATISITSSTEYSVAIDSGQTGTWTPVAGFSLAGATITGSFTKSPTSTSGSVRLTLSSLAINSRATFNNLVVDGAMTCASGTSCSYTFAIAASLTVQTSNPFTINVTGSVNTSTNTVSITGSSTSITLNSSFTLNAVSFSYSKTPTSTTANISGSATVLGATASLSIDLTASGNIVVTGGLTGFSPFGSSGPTVGAEIAAVVAGSGSVTWSPSTPALQALALPAVTLPTSGVHITAAFTAPTSISKLLGSSSVPSTCVLRANVTSLSVVVTGTTTACDLSGTATRASESAEWGWDVSGRFAGPYQLMTGVKLKSVSVRIRKPAGGAVAISASGSLDLSINGGAATTFTFDVAALADSGDFTLTLGTAPGTFAFTPFAGLTLNQVSGTIQRTATAMSLNFVVSQKVASAWTPVTGVSVSGAQVSLGANCTNLSNLSTCAVTLGFSGSVALTIAGSTSFTLAGSYSSATGWNITASVGNLNIASGVRLTSASLALTIPNSGSVTVKATGQFSVFSSNFVASATFSSSGLLLEATASGSWTPFTGGPTFNDVSVVFATYAIPSYDPPGAVAVQPLRANDPTLFGSVTIPSALLSSLGLTGVQVTPVGLSLNGLSTGNFELNIGIPVNGTTYLARSPATGTVQSGIRIISFGVRMVFANWVPSFGLYAEGGLKVPSQASEIPVVVDLSVTVTGELSVSATLGINAQGAQIPWTNAFGVSGLTVNNLAVSFSYQSGMPFPGFGAAISLQLPPSLRSLVGMDSGVSLSAVLNISPTAFCMSVMAGSASAGVNGPKVVNLLGGGLTATYAEFTFAPLGCTVGRVTVPAGIRAGFTGRVAGVSIDVRASINTTAGEFSITADIGAFAVGPVNLDSTRFEVYVSASRPTSSYLRFSGGFSVGSTSLRATVSLSATTYSLTATATELPLVPGLVVVKSATISANVSITSALLDLSINGTVEVLRASVTAALNVRISGGRVERLSGSVSTTVAIGTVMSINGNFNFDMATATPSIAVSGTITIGNLTVASVSGSITSQALSISASVNFANVFTGSVTGKVVWCNSTGAETITNGRGQEVTASAGDFYFASSVGVSLPVGGFSATGQLKLGYSNGAANATRTVTKQACSGAISSSGVGRSFFGSLSASLALGGSAFGGTASFAGSIDTSGAVDMSASLSVNLGVASSNATLTAKKSANGNYAFTFSGSATLAGSAVALSGSFSRTNGSTTYSFTGSAYVNMYVATVAVAFTLSNAGASGTATISVGSTSTAKLYTSVTLSLQSAGFFVSATGTVTLLTNYTATATVEIATMRYSGGAWRSTPLYANVNFTLSILSFNFAVSGSINNGNFSFTASLSSSGSTGKLDCIFVWCKGKYDASLSLTISNSSPYLSISARLALYYKAWNSWNDEPGWSSAGSFNATVTLSPPSIRLTVNLIPGGDANLRVAVGPVTVVIN